MRRRQSREGGARRLRPAVVVRTAVDGSGNTSHDRIRDTNQHGSVLDHRAATTDPSYWNTRGDGDLGRRAVGDSREGLPWDQPGGIGGWVLKAEPYCAPSYWAGLDRMVLSAEAAQAVGRGDSGDAALWQQVQSEKETLFIDPTDALVITEASVSPTQEWVRVTYNTTDDSSRNPDPAPQYGGQEDVIMSKVGGQWLVSGEANAAGEG